MRTVFLGKPLHWALLAVIAGVLWVVGEYHLHVTQFNAFVFIALGLATGILGAVVFSHRDGERVMREPPEGHSPRE